MHQIISLRVLYFTFCWPFPLYVKRWAVFQQTNVLKQKNDDPVLLYSYEYNSNSKEVKHLGKGI